MTLSNNKDKENRAADDEFVKPKVYRNRSKKKELPPLAERDHPRHKPYEREHHKDYTVTDGWDNREPLNHLLEDDWDGEHWSDYVDGN